MAYPGMIGFNAMIGLAEETTWGTYVTPDHWLPILGHSIEPSLDIRPVPYLGVASGQVYTTQRDSVALGHMVGGDVRGCCAYDDKAYILLLKHLFGGVTTTGPATTQYTHTLSPRTDGVSPTGGAVIGLTAHIVQGSGVSSPAENFTGIRPDSMEWSCDALGQLNYRCSVIGKRSTGMTTIDGTPAFTAAEEVLAHQGATMSWDSLTLSLRSFRIQMANNLARRPVIGSQYTDRPIAGGFAAVTADFVIPWESHGLYTAFLATDQADGTIAFTGTGDNSHGFTLHNMRMMGVSKLVEQAGELVFNARAMCFASPSDSEYGLKIILKNSNSAAI